MLQIHCGVVTGVSNIVVGFCKQLPWNQDDANVNCLNKYIVNRIAESTDFVCSHQNCSYHHKSESRYILHARLHFAFEVAPDAVCDTEFNGRGSTRVPSVRDRHQIGYLFENIYDIILLKNHTSAHYV